jgi:hypothetical protein
MATKDFPQLGKRSLFSSKDFVKYLLSLDNLEKKYFFYNFSSLNSKNSFLSLKKRGDSQLVSVLVASKFPILPMVAEHQMNAV